MTTKNNIKPQIQEIKTDGIFENNSDNIIKITESKARLTYHKYETYVGKNDIVTNLGLLAAFLIPIFTSDFKSLFFLSKDVLLSTFIIASAFFAYKLIKSTVNYFIKGKFMNENSFIADLKGQEVLPERIKREKIEQAKHEEYLKGYRDGLRNAIIRNAIHKTTTKGRVPEKDRKK